MLNWNLLTDFAPKVPRQDPGGPSSDSDSSEPTNGIVFCVALFFFVFTGIGYVLLGTNFYPAANEMGVVDLLGGSGRA